MKEKQTLSTKSKESLSQQINQLANQLFALYDKVSEPKNFTDEKAILVIKTIVNSLEKKKTTLSQTISALDSLDEGIVLFNKKGNVTYSNHSFCNIIGFQEDPTNLHWTYIFGKDCEFSISRKIVKLVRNNESFSERFSFKRSDFKKITVKFKLTPIDDNGFLCSISDVTRETKNKKLIEQQSNLIEAANDFIGLTNKDFEFTFLNESAKKMIGIYNLNITLKLKDLVSKQEVGLMKEIELRLEDSNHWKGEFLLNSTEGTIPVECEITKGKGLYNIIIQDISERKKAFSSLLKAKNLAEKNMEMRQQFLANMSHEIRTPMNAIIGLSNLLSETSLDGKQKEYTDSIKLSSENLLVIINDILDLSKIESGKLNFESIPFSTEKLIDSIHKTFQYKTRKKSLFFNIEQSSNLPDYIEGDPTRLSQVIINLVNNAIKFTPNGGITLNISVRHQRENDLIIRFEITDTGIGISPENQSSIFQPFTQEFQDTTRKYGGTGLGLAIVKQIVELQGGNVSLKSELGKGSSFIVDLPFKIHKKEISNDKTNQKSNQSKLKKAKIIMAEDYPMNQLLAKSLFDKWDLNLKIVNNGLELIEEIKKDDYKIILMDIQMPEMDGIEATKKIRSMGINTPIVAITAHAFKEERENCLKNGMNDFIAKPFNENEIFEKLVQYANLSNEDLEVITNAELKEIDKINGTSLQHKISPEDFQQFQDHAPTIIDEFQKGIALNDENLLKRSGILMQTLFNQVGEKEIAEKFQPLSRGKFTNKEQLLKLFELAQSTKNNILSLPKENHSNKASLNINQIKELAGQNKKMGRELIELYLLQSGEQLNEIEKEIKHQNIEQIGKLIHSMKASFIMLEAQNLLDQAISLEKQCLTSKASIEEIKKSLTPFIKEVNESFSIIQQLGKEENFL